MEENSFDFIQMVGATLLFVFALSCGILSYSRVNDRVEQYINVNTYNRRGTTATAFGNENDIMRKADRAEIIMSVITLPRTVQTRGNENYSIRVIAGDVTYKFSMSTEANKKDILMFEINSSSIEYDTNATTSDNNNIDKLVKDMKTCFKDSNAAYTVSYNKTSLTYTKVN